MFKRLLEQYNVIAPKLSIIAVLVRDPSYWQAIFDWVRWPLF